MTGTTAEFDACIAAARPQALGALARYFRDLDQAEEAFQEACLRALRSWPEKGRPKDPTAWLIFVGRNFGVDEQRRRRRLAELPPEETFSERGDTETEKVEQMETEQYRDDVLRLLFICCRPELPIAQQIAVALRLVAGLSVAEIARSFLVGTKAMEQRITRAKRRIAKADVPFSAPTRVERTERLKTVALMIYLLFNEGYSASGGEAQVRIPLCEEAIRLSRLLLRLFPDRGEIMGLLALCLLQHSRSEARLDDQGEIILLEDQERDLWHQPSIIEGQALVEKALRLGSPGSFQVQAAIAAVHAQAAKADDTDWHEIDRLYVVLERIQPTPVVTLNRAVAVSKARGSADALALIEPLSNALADYFHYHGVRGALLADLGQDHRAGDAFRRALGLARTPAEISHIKRRIEEIGAAPH